MCDLSTIGVSEDPMCDLSTSRVSANSSEVFEDSVHSDNPPYLIGKESFSGGCVQTPP